MDYNIIKDIPVIALRGITILPDMIMNFDVTRKKTIEAVEKAMLGNQKVFLVTQMDQEISDPTSLELYRIGVIARIKQIAKVPGGLLRVLVEEGKKGEVLSYNSEEPYISADVIYMDEIEDNASDASKEAMLRIIKDLLGEYAIENNKVTKETIKSLRESEDLHYILNQIVISMPLYHEYKQRFLEAVNITEEYELATEFLSNEIEVIKIKKEYQDKIKEKIDKNQKEYILREQLKLIREELGEENTVSESDAFYEELKKLTCNNEVKERIEKEIKRFKNISSGSSEGNVIRGYIETLLEMPWDKTSKDNKDIKNAEKILNRDHYGLEKVKERILEFLAVRSFTEGKGKSPVICLVGPPGTGKTSIAKSVAESLNKKYVRISLGGVRDEAEIRGHRKTYVGAMPGRIATGLKQAGVKNPLMLLDEIDKLGSDYKGDPAAALLEVLDGEQNNKFRDHYIELSTDLSEVLFVATANDVSTIPGPLLDRMELINISGYTINEKEHIFKEHLLDKQRDVNGLSKRQLNITSNAVKDIITGYTREAGVRNLERVIGKICRKTAKELLESDKKTVKITEKNLEKYLGKIRYRMDQANKEAEIGIVRGLAWTSVGGDTLSIEVNVMKGSGEFLLTGKLGDVMKESAQTGISYIRSVAKDHNIEDSFFKENDIHIHIPEGAVPKDGPSAGITMATAMLSAITGVRVRADVAMTGEITLRGKVLPIGGLKEKILAAKMAGIKIVVIPEKNKRDLDEISEEIKSDIEIIFAETMDRVLRTAFVKEQI